MKTCVALLQGMELFFDVWYVFFLYIACCNGIQCDLAQYAANQTKNTWANSLSVFFYVRYTTHITYSFTSHPKDATITVRYLAKVSSPRLESTLYWSETKELKTDPLIHSSSHDTLRNIFTAGYTYHSYTNLYRILTAFDLVTFISAVDEAIAVCVVV